MTFLLLFSSISLIWMFFERGEYSPMIEDETIRDGDAFGRGEGGEGGGGGGVRFTSLLIPPWYGLLEDESEKRGEFCVFVFLCFDLFTSFHTSLSLSCFLVFFVFVFLFSRLTCLLIFLSFFLSSISISSICRSKWNVLCFMSSDCVLISLLFSSLLFKWMGRSLLFHFFVLFSFLSLFLFRSRSRSLSSYLYLSIYLSIYLFSSFSFFFLSLYWFLVCSFILTHDLDSEVTCWNH